MNEQKELVFYDKAEMIFHDSVPLEESALPEAREKAKKQKAMVLSVFEHHQQLTFTAYEIWLVLNEMGGHYRMLITSVRRSITNLTKGNRLIKCQWSERRMGQYGKDTRTWRFNTEYVAPLNPQLEKEKKRVIRDLLIYGRAETKLL